jgi:glycosyltransferase involved in cell wall biosynthesis
MKENLKISIITPTFNAEKYIEDAIKCVLNQNYQNIEHIIVDAGSKDSTIKIIKKYPHLKWISEKDKGQSDAMNKGFQLSTGDIIGYLNADDLYNPEIFNLIAKYFNEGADFVQGKIKVEQEDRSYIINDGKITFDEIIRHWNPDAFCVNPVGYFYRREVQEKVGGYDINNHFSMDLQFLVAASKNYKFTKVKEDVILGVFRNYEQTKTSVNQKETDIWNTETFWFIEDYIKDLPENKKQEFYKDQIDGYKMRKLWQSMENDKDATKKLSFLEKLKSYFKK